MWAGIQFMMITRQLTVPMLRHSDSSVDGVCIVLCDHSLCASHDAFSLRTTFPLAAGTASCAAK